MFALSTASAPRRNQALAHLQPQQLPSGFHKAAGLNRQSHYTRGLKAPLASRASLPAGPLHHRPRSLGVAGHLLGGDGGMHENHQAGVAELTGHNRQPLSRCQARASANSRAVRVRAAVHSGRHCSWMRPMALCSSLGWGKGCVDTADLYRQNRSVWRGGGGNVSEAGRRTKRWQSPCAWNLSLSSGSTGWRAALARAEAPASAKRLRSMWSALRMAMKPGGSRT